MNDYTIILKSGVIFEARFDEGVFKVYAKPVGGECCCLFQRQVGSSSIIFRFSVESVIFDSDEKPR